jgi:hypothetical protein
MKAIGTVLEAGTYNPHDGLDFAVKEGAMHPIDKMLKEIRDNPNARVFARLVECKEDTSGKLEFRTRETASRNKFLSSLDDAQETALTRVRESGFEYDSTNSIMPFNRAGSDFIQIMGGPWSKQMYLADMLAMHARVWWEKTHNPVAKFYVDLITNFVFGNGVKIVFEDKEIQSKWDAYAEATCFHNRNQVECDELSCYGELMYQKGYTSDGLPIWKSRDPSTCWEIVTDPLDIEKIYYYHFQFPTQYQMFAKDGIKTIEYVLEQIPPTQIRHFKINVVSNEKRGRSDLFTVLSYLKRLDDYVTYKVVKAKNETAFIWDVLVKGDDRDVNAYINANQNVDPEAGSDFVHNEAIERKPLSPSGISSQKDGTFENLISLIAICYGIPASYFGIMGDTGNTKAAAVIGTEPISKKVSRRQEFFRPIVTMKVRLFLESLGVSGVPFEVIFPETQLDERSSKIKDLIFSRDSGCITDEQCANGVSAELKIKNFNFQSVRSELAKAKQDQMTMGMIQDNPLNGETVGDKMDSNARNDYKRGQGVQV